MQTNWNRTGMEIGRMYKMKFFPNQAARSKKFKGTENEYQRLHVQLRKTYGKANHCENCKSNNPKKKFEWANISGNYITDIADWIQLCHMCHSQLDKSGGFYNCKNSHEMTKENTYTNPKGYRACRICKTNSQNKVRQRIKRENYELNS